MNNGKSGKKYNLSFSEFWLLATIGEMKRGDMTTIISRWRDRVYVEARANKANPPSTSTEAFLAVFTDLRNKGMVQICLDGRQFSLSHYGKLVTYEYGKSRMIEWENNGRIGGIAPYVPRFK